MIDKTKLGTRYVCANCGTKFYDLNRPETKCPECGTDPNAEATKPKASLEDELAGALDVFEVDDNDDVESGDDAAEVPEEGEL